MSVQISGPGMLSDLYQNQSSLHGPILNSGSLAVCDFYLSLII